MHTIHITRPDQIDRIEIEDGPDRSRQDRAELY